MPETPATTDVFFTTRDCQPGQIAQGYRQTPGGTLMTLGHQTGLLDLQRLQDWTRALSRRLGRPLRALEVGSWVGESAMAIRTGMEHGGTLWCVDNFSGGTPPDSLVYVSRTLGRVAVENVFRLNCRPYLGNSIFLLKMDSRDAARLPWRGEPLDLIFLDGGHRGEDIREDLELWYPHLHPQGLLCGHDYDVEFYPELKPVVDRFAAQWGLELEAPRESILWAMRHRQTPS